jgi:hypothetical protein
MTTGSGNGNLVGVILAPTSAQTDSSINNSIYIDKTGVGSILNLSQSSTITGVYAANDLQFIRNLTGSTYNRSGSLLSLSDTSSGTGLNNPTGIFISETTPAGSSLYTGNFVDFQRSDVAGNPPVSKFSVSATGNVLTSGTFNGLTITNNGSNTLDIANGKTLNIDNSLTFTGTDATTFNFPTTSGGTVITSNAPSQTITSIQTSGTLLSLSDTTSLTGNIIGQSISLSGGNAYDQTGLLITLSGATGANLNAIVVNDGTTDTARIGKDGSGTFIGVDSGTGLIEGTGGLTVSGDVNLNTTTDNETNIGTGTGDVSIGNGSGTLTLGGFTTDKGVLFTDGSGVVSQTLQGSANTVLHGNGTGTPTFSAVDLSSDVSNTLSVSHGGTGATNLTLNGVLIGNNTSSVLTATGSAYQVLRIPSGGGMPAFGSIDLSQSVAVTGILGITNGGTGGTATPTSGGIAYGTGSAYAFTGAGTEGQALLSGGTGTPTWTTGTLTLDHNLSISGSSNLTFTTGGSDTNAILPVGNITLADLESNQTFSGEKTFTPSGGKRHYL